ncbi:MAG: tetrapyrrole methyltransferase domain-containing/MazG-like protein domain-containing protein, dITP/XTP pyrophosphatase [Candidatus Peregrinibacteria bacterium GW2011_GWF2_33_10]|nr:MAG: tetrapyrrole methyltransferase domain-containing/MazG-like protein domain-containing protein, dITP/XTP pyrophosphatase [Candidatus Peregrinibacteria bacterium GW2011_GWF2_33_10]OGJ45131.1 MAG: hypothetical protein A2263_05250 [Candidatus Peregrinibacteria bacterium RIFOXYA2_FULL_33_21]OGJ46501.1 MAG: hypothetical protein A2272_04885 [Candidatus Peregrinibacteria bacterium RIFOXYA12_FULL_33_12]OGJ50800.1 MAG: hypothetical protein A2307_02020 [Candidatus Peregrinibacteria bacterium RIFOXYB
MKEFQKLLDLVEKLRAPNGCPWDRKQTIESLAKCVKEEANEVLEAIEKKDYENLKEEIGDVILTLSMICQIAKENKLFDMQDCLKDVSKKIISRHTWVFGKDKAETAEEALKLWKKNKREL